MNPKPLQRFLGRARALVRRPRSIGPSKYPVLLGLEILEDRTVPSLFPAVLPLSTLNGGNGFALNGVANNDLSGRSVRQAGDVNGDGLDDLIVGAWGAAAGGFNRGQAYVVFGKSTSFAATLNLSSLNGSNGFTLNGIANGDQAGRSVSGAGDVNGDGLDDLVVGAVSADAGGSDRGQAYVIFGTTSGYAATLNLSSLNGSNGFTLNGNANGDQAGLSVSGAGDVNGDGLDDLIVGAFGADAGGSDRGQAYVVFGRSSGFAATLNLSSLNGSNGVSLNGIADIDWAGRFVSGAGDVNGDGLDDLIIGAPYADAGGSNRGQAYVIFGKSTGFAATMNLSSLNGSNGFTLNGSADGDFAGRSVSGAGDVNGDGLADVIVGAPSAPEAGGTGRGQSYVVFGRTNLIATGPDKGGGPVVNVYQSDSSLRFEILAYAENFSGGVRVAVGDITGDGQPDIITAPGPGMMGRIKAFDGRTGLPISSLPNIFRPYGIGYLRGVYVAAGDVNGDGKADIIVSPGAGARPVKVFDGNGHLLLSFFPYGNLYTGGVKVAAGDVTGTSALEIVTVRSTRDFASCTLTTHWPSCSATPLSCAISPVERLPSAWNRVTMPRSRKSWPTCALQANIEQILQT